MIINKKFFLAVILLLFWMVCFSFAQDYVVGEGDVLRITVYDHEDLTTIARISADEAITFPLIGQVEVKSMTLSQISQKISELLSDGYIVDPQVNIFIEEFRSKKTFIMGEVNKPGIHILHGTTTLLELLSEAGGLTKNAGDKAILKRKASPSDKNEKIIEIDLKKLIEKGDTSLDIPIMDGDSFYITKAGVFYVTGEIKKPDAYKYEEGTTVIKAITMAGGFTDMASEGRVKIIRKVSGKEEVIDRAKMDEPILPDDVIVVPESFF
ncbi:MAG: periplasmic polysaccharide biosynthesis/export protein [Nitrospirae bacterium RBG_13_39_12]|nr:MAG: periplasmic polysaccharide biosynthesis/export protein [Nitrospirae bacterium RBG_13_39_12]